MFFRREYNIIDGKAPNHTQPHNKKGEDQKSVYGFIYKYESNWAFVYLCMPNQDDNSRMKKCTKHILEFWSKEHKKIEFRLTNQHYFWVKL